ANYKILESLLRERRRKIRNEDLRTELEYFSEDYDEEREMEPRPEPHKVGNMRGRNAGGIRPSEIEAKEGENRGRIFPHFWWLIWEEMKAPFIPSNLHIPAGLMPIHVNPYSQPSANFVHGQAPNFPFQTQMGNPPAGGTYAYHPQRGYIPHAFTNNSIPSYNSHMHPTVTPSSSYPFYTQPMYAPPNMLAYPNPAGPFTDSADDTLQILGLHEEQRVSGFVHGLRTRSLIEHLSTDLSSTYKGLIEKTYTWVEARDVATNGDSNDRRDSFERSKKSSWDNNRGQKNKDRLSPYRGPNLGLLPIARVNNAPVIIEAKIFGRKVGRLYMDGGSSCEIIYESCFEKLNPTNKATKVDLKTPLVGFSGERSWSVGEVPLEITIGYVPLSRIETLNFVIVRSDSPHNMLLGRTAMQRMRIIVSTIHGAIKFHTEKGIGTVLSKDEPNEGTKRARKIPATSKEMVLSCVDAE
ncbi:reverse transcriptase domain-containing protein, partial [Tanacetum coccineum]